MAPARGVSFVAGDEPAASYLSDTLTVDPRATTILHDVGGAWIFNVTPGSLTISATANERTCREEYRADAPADVAELVVDADSVSIAAFRCD